MAPAALAWVAKDAALELAALVPGPSAYDSLPLCLSPIRFWHAPSLAGLIVPLFWHHSAYHLYYNTLSFMNKAFTLERVLGSAKFGALLALLALGAQAGFACAAWALCMGGVWDDPYYEDCVSGFSAVAFALKVVAGRVAARGGVGARERFFFFDVEASWAAWLELALVYFLQPNSSLLAHCCGIATGYAVVELAPEMAGLPPRPVRATPRGSGGASGAGGAGRGWTSFGSGRAADAGAAAAAGGAFAGGAPPEPRGGVRQRRRGGEDDDYVHVQRSDAQ